MRFGVYVPLSGEYDVRAVAELAREAEAAGWEGFFVWDNLLATFDGSGVLADTTVALTAIALATERVRFGPIVTPLPRRRPWKVAKEMATLDRMSGGRLTLGAGLGGFYDTWPVGDEADVRRRAGALEEGLEIVTALWRGEPASFAGTHYTVRDARQLPVPVQLPRIPIWLGGHWPGRAPFRRAARWDGIAPVRQGHGFEGLSPDELEACVEYTLRHRESDAPFDVVHFQTTAAAPGTVERYAQAGATWWLESTFPVTETPAEFRRRVLAGPPA